MIDIRNLSIQFTGENLFSNVNLKINRGDRIALVGSNGSGKSTLLRLLTGEEHPETGDLYIQKGTRTGYLPQEFIALKGKNLLEEVRSSVYNIADIEKREKELLREIEIENDIQKKSEIASLIGELNSGKERIDYYSIDSRAQKVLIGLGFSETDFERNIEEFSGGWQMRAELAKLLLEENDLLLLDEPTNHLDIDSLRWLTAFLKSYRGAMIIVSHDRYFINAVTERTLEIYNKNVSFFNGRFSEYQEYREERNRQILAEYKNQQKKRKSVEKFIERFRYKATKAKQVQSRIKQLDKDENIILPDEENEINIRFPDPPKSGIIPIELKDISKWYGNLEVFSNFSLQIERGDKIALVGPNGAGKTTLSKIISGRLSPTGGERMTGHNTSVSYYAQEVTEDLDMTKDVLDSMMDISDEYTPGQLRTLLGSFLFSDEDIFKKVSVLSGGEKSRVALAKLMLTKANLIILDEPTNHLDFNSKKVLQQALINFSGTVVLVSHDIDFLAPITNKTIEVRDNRLKIYYGNINYYLEKKEEEEEQVTSAPKQTPKENGKVTRKEQKRIEAELRKKRYELTRDLKKNIETAEKALEENEAIKVRLEEELADPEIYNNSGMAKEKNLEYGKIKETLENLYENWAALQEELEEIEKSIEDEEKVL